MLIPKSSKTRATNVRVPGLGCPQPPTHHIPRMDNPCEGSEFLNKLDLAYFVSTSQLFDAFQADNRDMPAVVTDHDIDLAARVWETEKHNKQDQNAAAPAPA